MNNQELPQELVDFINQRAEYHKKEIRLEFQRAYCALDIRTSAIRFTTHNIFDGTKAHNSLGAYQATPVSIFDLKEVIWLRATIEHMFDRLMWGTQGKTRPTI